MSLKLYVEGGGNSKALKAACRRGFRVFLEKAGLAGRMPRIVACGGRQHAYDRFLTGLAASQTNSMLLVDAEAPVTAAGAWEHLGHLEGWTRPESASEDQCHLMVQVMESWFLADKETLASFYGHRFNQSVLPASPSLEKVAKEDVYQGLRRATRNTRKGAYSKSAHSFDVLAELDPERVEDAAPHAKLLLETLRSGG